MTDHCKLFLSGGVFFYFNWFALCSYICLLLHFAFFFFFKLVFWDCLPTLDMLLFLFFCCLINVSRKLYKLIYVCCTSCAVFLLTTGVHTLCCNSYGDTNVIIIIIIFFVFSEKWQWLWITFGTSCSKQRLIWDSFSDTDENKQQGGLKKLISGPPAVILVTPGLTQTFD